MADRQRRAATGIAVHLRQHGPVRLSSSWNAFADFTASCPVIASATNRISLRLQQLLQRRHLVHQLGSNMVAARRIDNQRVAPGNHRLAPRLFRQPQHVVPDASPF